MPPHTWDTVTIAPRIQAMMTRWAENRLSERASLQPFIIELCAALGVAAPAPSDADEYQFEFPVHVTERDGKTTTNFIDCWKAGHFALEGKATGDDIPDENRLRKAFGQVRTYVAHVFGDAPPYLMVLDVPRHLIIWDRWSGRYGDFAAGGRINLVTLHTRPEDIALLCDIFEQPGARDPRSKAQAVTKEIAAKLAELSAALESRVGDQERVARFLMRCVFSCFAEDVGLLPKGLFERTLTTARDEGGPSEVGESLSLLWKTMDGGGRFGAERVQHFNGHFFKTVEALPLEPREVDLLIEAAHFDWSRVEPSIFGTLLVRALDPEERHRLGAEFTPREYIERLVEPTVVEPIRERWTAVQAAVVQMNPVADDPSTKKPKAQRNAEAKVRHAATAELLKFHEWLRGLSFLDPACGSGNFLYVTMAAMKRIELEVLNEIQRLAGGQGGLVLDEVHPRQFHGIEIKMWAREIAELTLWIGYHQFWRETHGGRTPPIPILEDTGTLECRDAVLAWDSIVHRPEKDRPDPTPRITHHVTGELVPDPKAKLPYYEYVNARPAEWPRADFIVGNPPYIGEKRQRGVLGEGYVDALRSAYGGELDSSDFVMYWWRRCAQRVSVGEVERAGLITTNSITQSKNRAEITRARESGARVIWAVPDHPWVAEADGAAVRVSLTVLSSAQRQSARWIEVADDGSVVRQIVVGRLNDDLSPGADVESAGGTPLRANEGLCWQGFKLVGDGFLLSTGEAAVLRAQSDVHERLIRRWRNGRDLTDRPRDVYAIDFGSMTEEEARATPVLYDIVRSRVKPERDSNRDKGRRERWWRFGRTNENLRSALTNLRRYIATVEVSKIRFFVFLEADVAPDGALVLIGSDDAFVLGVVSSRLHVEWTLAAGGTLEDRPRYNKDRCFDAFPFPAASRTVRARITALAERLDLHRKSALARDERVTMTGMYNVVEKLRTGDPLTNKEREVHELAACGVLKDIHDELDTLVAEAYGWPWPMEREEILERLVSLHDERLEEEKRGVIRWLRPDYQIPRFAPKGAAPSELALVAREPTAASTVDDRRPWPSTAVEQIAAVGAAVAQAPRSVDEVAAAFSGARKDLVARHLETLAMMGEISLDADNRYRSALRVA
jgi:hypothetical protein